MSIGSEMPPAFMKVFRIKVEMELLHQSIAAGTISPEDAQATLEEIKKLIDELEQPETAS